MLYLLLHRLAGFKFNRFAVAGVLVCFPGFHPGLFVFNRFAVYSTWVIVPQDAQYLSFSTSAPTPDPTPHLAGSRSSLLTE